MGKYIGYFNGLDCKRYVVKITPSGTTGEEYEEVLLAANEPFVVRYNVSRTPFDPVRTSTATIKVVNDEYMYDALSHCAQGTKVELFSISNNQEVLEWVGYMTPKVYNAGYDSCWETFDLEAADCISSLQYIDYQEISGGGVTNLKEIINQICDATGELDGYYWTISKKTSGGTIITPDMLAISEHNFQTNDTDEYWKLNEVLQEICQYLGFTCLQWKNYMYFIDYQMLEPQSRLKAYKYVKSNNYNRDSTGGSTKSLDNYYEVTADSYMDKGATISLEPIYNKVVVNANMYAIEDFIPDPFSDAWLTNRINSGTPYASVEIPPHANTISQDHPYNQWYPNGGVLGITQSWKMEESADTQYIYHMRPYDHEYWESVYTNSGGTVENPSSAIQASSSITKDYRGGTLLDLGVVRKDHKSESNPAQWIVPSKMDYTRYLCICEKHINHKGSSSHGSDEGNRKVVFRLKNGYYSRARIDSKCFLVLDCNCIFERYDNCNYINPDWCDAQQKKRGTEAGTWHDSIPRPIFKIKIGNKSWDSSTDAWVSGDAYCIPQMRWDENKFTYWNKELGVLNNVSWQDKVNCEGIKLPLSGIDTTAPITFEVINPDPTFYGCTNYPDWEDKWYDMNSYCWIKDLSLKVVREGESDLGNDSDVVYENEISECSVNELPEIRVRVTTLNYSVKPSYSHMLLGDGFLESVKEEYLTSDPQIPEQNIIFKYVHQYSTPTKKMTLPLPIEITPLQKLIGVDVDMPTDGYVQLGTELDYRMAMQTITCVEKTKGNEN